MNDLKDRAKRVKILATDIDGVLTKGEIFEIPPGEKVKIWNIKDGLGFTMLRSSGLDIKTVWITAMSSRGITKRAKELGIDYIFQNCKNKKDVLEGVLRDEGLSWEEVAYIGDDFIDAGILKLAGLSVCPLDAPDEIKSICRYVSKKKGGEGVVREVIEIIIKAKGYWEKVLKTYGL